MGIFKNFEKVADSLEEQSRSFPQIQREVALRRAISTIYYGVFWELRERFRNRGYKIRERQPHMYLLIKLKDFNPHAYKWMGRLKKFRELADYQTEWKPDRKIYLLVKELANLILKEV